MPAFSRKREKLPLHCLGGAFRQEGGEFGIHLGGWKIRGNPDNPCILFGTRKSTEVLCIVGDHDAMLAYGKLVDLRVWKPALFEIFHQVFHVKFII